MLNLTFGILAPADLLNDFVVFLVAPVDGQVLIVPVLCRSVHIDIGIYSTSRCSIHLVLYYVINDEVGGSV
jgi:hypothetical protein